MIISLVTLAAASLLGSGILFQHQRWITYLGCAGALLEAQWLFITLLSRTVALELDQNNIYTISSAALLIAWALYWRRFTLPLKTTRDSTIREASVIIVIAIVMGAAGLISERNGYSNGQWITHGFFNGDTTTFAALVNRSLESPGLVRENPFAGGGQLEYPTLTHAAIAAILQSFKLEANWFTLWPVMTLVQIVIIIPLFFLLWDVIAPSPQEEWQQWFGIRARWVVYILQAILVLYVLALTWDNYVYLQSHFFITGLFILQMALLIVGLKERNYHQLPAIVSAIATAIVLMFANAVTGTAAMTVAAVFFLFRGFDKSRPLAERLAFLGGIPILMVIFLLYTPGNGSLGIIPGFSYTAALDMMRLAPVALVLALAVFWYLQKYTFINAAAASLIFIAFITFTFSTRNIVVENSSRFFYHAILIAFPLIMFSFIRGLVWVRRELLHTTHKLSELTVGWIISLTVIGFFVTPALASMASAHDNLMFKDEQIIDQGTLNAMAWIKDNVYHRDVFLASPDAPWTIPLFTGRHLLRTNYWLSPGDEIEAAVNAAFAGNQSARESVVKHADYLFLTAVERDSWEPIPLRKVFDNGSVVIYDLK